VSVEFDPIRVRRRRRLDPVVLGIGVAVVALVAAVAKPWETSTGGLAEASPAAAASSRVDIASNAPPSAPSRRPSAVPETEDGIPSLSWSDLAGIVGSHPALGALVVTGHASRFTRAGADIRLAASWASAESAAGGIGPNPDVRAGDASVLGIGATFPRDAAPRDVRVWLERSGGAWEWIDTVPVARPSADDPIVLVRPGPGSTIEPFEAGRYRLDLLGKDRIDRMVAGIADSTGSLPDPSRWPGTETRLVPADRSDPSALGFGLFATVDGFAVSLPVAQSRPLDELDAWDATRAEPVAGTPAVVTAFLPRATGLGVMLTSHASVELALLSRLAPTPLVPVPPVRGGLSEAQGRTPYIVFDGPDGRALEPGVYALSVSWTDAGGLHAGTWHVELRPGPVHD
jgi:hypothetical protein